MMDQRKRNCLVMGPMTCTVGHIGEQTVGVMYDRSNQQTAASPSGVFSHFVAPQRGSRRTAAPTWFVLYGGDVRKTVSKVDKGFQMKLDCDKSVEIVHNEGFGIMAIKDHTITIVVTPKSISWH